MTATLTDEQRTFLRDRMWAMPDPTSTIPALDKQRRTVLRITVDKILFYGPAT